MLSSSTIIEEQTMVIKREEIDSRQVDFTAVHSGRRLPPVHPGEILRDEFLMPMGISVYELANAIKAPRSRVNDIVLGRRTISTDTALRLGRYFGTSPEFWINLQARYDLDVADRTVRRRIEREVKPRAAPGDFTSISALSPRQLSR
jgi:addiction module HigA family antidote